MMVFKPTFTVEKIENGFVVTHVEAKRAVFVLYDFEVVRQVERFMHDEVVRAQEEQAEREALASKDSRPAVPEVAV